MVPKTDASILMNFPLCFTFMLSKRVERYQRDIKTQEQTDNTWSNNKQQKNKSTQNTTLKTKD